MDEKISQESFEERTMIKVRNASKRLREIWSNIGYDDEMQSAYRAEAYKHMQDLLDDMVAEAEEKERNLLHNLEQLMSQATILSKELGKDMTSVVLEKLPLYEAKVALYDYVHNLQHIKDQRLAYLKKLLAKEYEICQYLGVRPVGVDKDLPTEEELENFNLYLEKQEAEKNHLETIFQSRRNSIIEMMNELEIKPSLNFENLVCNDPTSFVFSNTNMTKLKELHEQLTVQVDNAKRQVAKLKEELISFWKYLDEPPHTCEQFLENYTGYSAVTIDAISAEIKRCKEKRRENIAKCVNQMRTELVKLWELCKCDENERNKFSPFNCQTYTEDLLTLHELEIERLRKYYDTNRHIYSLLTKRESLLEKAKELKQRANDPDRFHNRGGQLLAEEKERKIISNKLPKLEEELISLVQAYECSHGDTFTINGMSIQEYLTHSRETLDVKKPKKSGKLTPFTPQKEARDKSSKNLLSASKYTPTGTSVRHNTFVHGVSKRKLLGDPSPNTSNSKRRNLSAEKLRPTVTSTKIRRSGKMPRRILTPRSDRKKRRSDVQRSRDNDMTYGQFQEHLEEREELRSSLLPERVLQNSNKSNFLKTPTRTPVKSVQKNLPSSATPRTTPRLSARKSPHSPRTIHTPKLATAPKILPIIF